MYVVEEKGQHCSTQARVLLHQGVNPGLSESESLSRSKVRLLLETTVALLQFFFFSLSLSLSPRLFPSLDILHFPIFCQFERIKNTAARI